MSIISIVVLITIKKNYFFFRACHLLNPLWNRKRRNPSFCAISYYLQKERGSFAFAHVLIFELSIHGHRYEVQDIK